MPKRKLRGLLSKHAAVFARDVRDLGLTDIVTYDIETGDAKPIRQPLRRAPSTLQEDMDNEIQGMLDKGVIEPVREHHLWFWSKRRIGVCTFV